MPRARVAKVYWTYRQTARYFGIGEIVVEQLIAEGELSGIEIPASGRKGRVRLVSIESINIAEKRWAAGPPADEKKPRPRTDAAPALRRIPELRSSD